MFWTSVVEVMSTSRGNLSKSESHVRVPIKLCLFVPVVLRCSYFSQSAWCLTPQQSYNKWQTNCGALRTNGWRVYLDVVKFQQRPSRGWFSAVDDESPLVLDNHPYSTSTSPPLPWLSPSFIRRDFFGLAITMISLRNDLPHSALHTFSSSPSKLYPQEPA